jgi:hypothetical protein
LRQETEDGGSASAYLDTCPLEDHDSDDYEYCGLVNLLSVQTTPRDTTGGVSNGGWSADSHAAELSRLKRPFTDVEGDGGSPIDTQRQRIEPQESGSIDTQDDAMEAEDSHSGGTDTDDNVLSQNAPAPQSPDLSEVSRESGPQSPDPSELSRESSPQSPAPSESSSNSKRHDSALMPTVSRPTIHPELSIYTPKSNFILS